MTDGDAYDVCCRCGTEFLVKAMHQVTQCGLRLCERCYAEDQDWPDADERDPDDFVDTNHYLGADHA